MTQMRIEKLVLKGLNQFRNLHLDFTDPQTGEPLEKVCFIGPNGTGKTTLLDVLQSAVWPAGSGSGDSLAPSIKADALRILTLRIGNQHLQYVTATGYAPKKGFVAPLDIFDAAIENDGRWSRFVDSDDPAELTGSVLSELRESYGLSGDARTRASMNSLIRSSEGVLVSACRMDLDSEFIEQGLPQTTLSNALALAKQFPIHQFAGAAHAKSFWNTLIYQIKQRDEDWQSFLQQPANRSKTVADAEAEFDSTHPDILAEIAKLWSRILDKAGLEFDYQSAKRPTQLTDNLEAFVRVKGTGEVIKDYNVLSSGMRNFLFRLGHIFTLYFNRKIERGFLFVDEPEDSLYPDFLYDLIDIYLDIIKGQNTQFFVATHSPIIAAQFRPEERFILNFDESYHVVATRGVSPEGDDPNDLLDKDFAVASLYGKKGIENWRRFVELRRQIEHETDKTKKLALADEYMTIGNAYNFRPDEIPDSHALPQ